MTLYDELFETCDSLASNDIECTLEAYCKQSVFPDYMVKDELDRLCEEGEFVLNGKEYKIFV